MKFISSKAIVLTFLGLILYLTFDFYNKKEEDFWQLNYDWQNTEVIENLGKGQIKSVETNFVEISFKNDVTYNQGNTLQLELSNEKYFFSFENAYVKDKIIKFTGGFWVLDKPIPNHEKVEAKIINLPLKQTGEIKISLITDSQLLWRGGRSFRKWIKEKETRFSFVGDKIDLYGLPYTGEILNTTEKASHNLEEIPFANVYVVSLGTHDPKNDIANSLINYKLIIERILAQNKSAKIYLINIPPSLNLKRNAHYIKYNEALNHLSSRNIFIVDFYSLIENQQEKLESKDKIHYNANAYKLLAKQLIKQINGEK